MSTAILIVIIGYSFLWLAYRARENGQRFFYYWFLAGALAEFTVATLRLAGIKLP